MTLTGIIDTTVLVHLFRGSKSALKWLANSDGLGVTSITRLEFIYGARGKIGLNAAVKLLDAFFPITLESIDQNWAIEQMIRYRLSRGIEINDTLIASVCYRLQLPLFTHNVKDMLKLLPEMLVVIPYSLDEAN